MRPTWLDLPDDREAWAECDEQLLGRDLLAALVVEPGATTRSLRPPAGSEWIDVWSGARHASGVWTTVPAPLDGPPPLFARAGSGMLVDLARGGIRPEPTRLGLLLFPLAGDGAFRWEAFDDDDDDGDGEPDVWSAVCRCNAHRIAVAIERRGRTGPHDLTIVLQPGETRTLVLSGGTVRGSTVTL